MRTTYILDTSALIFNPLCYKNFSHCNVIIPIVVLSELDKLKTQSGEVGKSARVAIRLIDDLSNTGDISEGIIVDNDTLVKVDATYIDTTEKQYVGFGDPAYGDTQILACAYLNWLSHPTQDVTLISNDINLRIKAKARGIGAKAGDDNKLSISDLYLGAQTIVDDEAGYDLQKFGNINAKDYGLELSPNECVLFQNETGDGIAMGRKLAGDKIKLIKKHCPWNLNSRNKEQAFAIDLMMDKNIDLVTLIGKAGTGKSLIALATALELVINRREYDKLVIYRPIQSVSNDIGYTPGPQPLDAKILTPTGWTTMGDLKIGSQIITKNGTSANVLGIYPKGTKSVYKIITTEGETECCEDHLWVTQTFENKKRNKPGLIKTTKEIIETLKTKNGKINHYLPRNKPVQFNKNKLPLAPYTLGVILGDGSIGNSIAIINKDLELINRVEEELLSFKCKLFKDKNIKYNISSELFNNKPAKSVKITNILTNEEKIYPSIGIANKDIKINKSTLHHRCVNNTIKDNIKYEFINDASRWSNPVKNTLYDLGLSNKKAWEKFIPLQYKFSSIEDRVALLQGLMDTDGTIKSNGEASFCTTSKQLALDVIELVKSLGGKANLCTRNRIGKKSYLDNREIESKRVSYEFTISMPENINPFYISRKAIHHKCNYLRSIGIKSVEYVGEKEVQCILIDDPEHLYITDDFIVTHNTVEEKLAPWFQAILDSFEVLFTTKSGDNWKRELEMFQKKGKIAMEAITYIRGRSIPNSIILLDEAQNLSNEDIKTILTRAGENTKIILTGDIEQIDNPKLDASNNGLVHVIEKFKESELAGHITFTNCERSRLASKAAELL